MKKIVVAITLLALMLSLFGCAKGTQTNAGSEKTDSVSANSGNADSNAPEKRGKIAILRNLSNSDHTTNFFAGAVAEGEALGYQVDTFLSNNDDVVMQDLMNQALQKDYDIWIVSHANEGYQYDMISKAVEAGIKVVGFDCAGEHVEGVTYTSANEDKITRITLDAMIEAVKAAGGSDPVQFCEITILGINRPLTLRQEVVDEYIDNGTIELITLINPDLKGDVYSQIYTMTQSALEKNSQPFGIWAAWAEGMEGAIAAINDAGRTNVYLSAVDISNANLAQMEANEFYYCLGAIDPYVQGMLDVRIAVCKDLGLETPEEYLFDSVPVKRPEIDPGESMSTLGSKYENFGWSEEFNYDEVKALRELYAAK